MNINKQQVIQGFKEFIAEDIIPEIQDKPLKMALYAATMLPVVDGIIEKPMVKAVLNESNGMYNLDDLQNALNATMDRFGSFPITIQAIPFLVPGNIEISLTKADVDNLFRHWERVANYG